MGTVKGKDLMFFRETGDSVKAYKAWTYGKDCSFSVSAKEDQTTSKDSGDWEESEISGLSWSGSTEMMISVEGNDPYDELFDIMTSKQPIPLWWSRKKEVEMPDGGWSPTEAKGYKGKALITSLENGAPVEGRATVKVTFKGTGPLEKAKAASQSLILENKNEEEA